MLTIAAQCASENSHFTWPDVAGLFVFGCVTAFIVWVLGRD